MDNYSIRLLFFRITKNIWNIVIQDYLVKNE